MTSWADRKEFLFEVTREIELKADMTLEISGHRQVETVEALAFIDDVIEIGI